MWEGTAWGARKGQLLAIPVWKWFCNRKPLVTPSRTVFVARARSGEQLAETGPNAPTQTQPQFSFRSSDFRRSHSFIFTQAIECWWTDGWMKEWAGTFHSPPPARRDYCALCSLMVPQLFLVFVFVCVWTANADEQEPRPQNTKLLHNVADNYHDNIHGLKRREREREGKKEERARTAGVEKHCSVTEIYQMRHFFSPPWDVGCECGRYLFNEEQL